MNKQRGEGAIYLRFSWIHMYTFKKLAEGTQVEFEVKTGPKGLNAENIVRV